MLVDYGTGTAGRYSFQQSVVCRIVIVSFRRCSFYYSHSASLCHIGVVPVAAAAFYGVSSVFQYGLHLRGTHEGTDTLTVELKVKIIHTAPPVLSYPSPEA